MSGGDVVSGKIFLNLRPERCEHILMVVGMSQAEKTDEGPVNRAP